MNSTQIQVMAASQRWIEQFNYGDMDACLASYASDALMVVSGKGTFRGHQEIGEFWKPLIDVGAGELEYTGVVIEVISESQAALSASWQMNTGRGVITKELWARGDDGVWRLSEDHFEIQDHFDPAATVPVKKTALITIDLQQDYFPGGKMALSDQIHTASSNAGRLLTCFRESHQPRLHVRHVFLKKDAPFFAPGTFGAGIHPSVAPEGGEQVIVKNHINSFLNTELESVLRAWQIERVVICGAMSHMCIEGTARAAADLGFKCVVAEDACATLDLEYNGQTIPAAQVHGTSMAALAFAYGQVSSTDQVIGQIQNACAAVS